MKKSSIMRNSVLLLSVLLIVSGPVQSSAYTHFSEADGRMYISASSEQTIHIDLHESMNLTSTDVPKILFSSNGAEIKSWPSVSHQYQMPVECHRLLYVDQKRAIMECLNGLSWNELRGGWKTLRIIASDVRNKNSPECLNPIEIKEQDKLLIFCYATGLSQRINLVRLTLKLRTFELLNRAVVIEDYAGDQQLRLVMAKRLRSNHQDILLFYTRVESVPFVVMQPTPSDLEKYETRFSKTRQIYFYDIKTDKMVSKILEAEGVKSIQQVTAAIDEDRDRVLILAKTTSEAMIQRSSKFELTEFTAPISLETITSGTHLKSVLSTKHEQDLFSGLETFNIEYSKSTKTFTVELITLSKVKEGIKYLRNTFRRNDSNIELLTAKETMLANLQVVGEHEYLDKNIIIVKKYKSGKKGEVDRIAFVMWLEHSHDDLEPSAHFVYPGGSEIVRMHGGDPHICTMDNGEILCYKKESEAYASVDLTKSRNQGILLLSISNSKNNNTIEAFIKIKGANPRVAVPRLETTLYYDPDHANYIGQIPAENFHAIDSIAANSLEVVAGHWLSYIYNKKTLYPSPQGMIYPMGDLILTVDGQVMSIHNSCTGNRGERRCQNFGHFLRVLRPVDFKQTTAWRMHGVVIFRHNLIYEFSPESGKGMNRHIDLSFAPPATEEGAWIADEGHHLKAKEFHAEAFKGSRMYIAVYTEQDKRVRVAVMDLAALQSREIFTQEITQECISTMAISSDLRLVLLSACHHEPIEFIHIDLNNPDSSVAERPTVVYKSRKPEIFYQQKMQACWMKDGLLFTTNTGMFMHPHPDHPLAGSIISEVRSSKTTIQCLHQGVVIGTGEGTEIVLEDGNLNTGRRIPGIQVSSVIEIGDQKLAIIDQVGRIYEAFLRKADVILSKDWSGSELNGTVVTGQTGVKDIQSSNYEFALKLKPANEALLFTDELKFKQITESRVGQGPLVSEILETNQQVWDVTSTGVGCREGSVLQKHWTSSYERGYHSAALYGTSIMGLTQEYRYSNQRSDIFMGKVDKHGYSSEKLVTLPPQCNRFYPIGTDQYDPAAGEPLDQLPHILALCEEAHKPAHFLKLSPNPNKVDHSHDYYSQSSPVVFPEELALRMEVTRNRPRLLASTTTRALFILDDVMFVIIVSSQNVSAGKIHILKDKGIVGKVYDVADNLVFTVAKDGLRIYSAAMGADGPKINSLKIECHSEDCHPKEINGILSASKSRVPGVTLLTVVYNAVLVELYEVRKTVDKVEISRVDRSSFPGGYHPISVSASASTIALIVERVEAQEMSPSLPVGYLLAYQITSINGKHTINFLYRITSDKLIDATVLPQKVYALEGSIYVKMAHNRAVVLNASGVRLVSIINASKSRCSLTFVQDHRTTTVQLIDLIKPEPIEHNMPDNLASNNKDSSVTSRSQSDKVAKIKASDVVGEVKKRDNHEETPAEYSARIQAEEEETQRRYQAGRENAVKLQKKADEEAKLQKFKAQEELARQKTAEQEALKLKKEKEELARAQAEKKKQELEKEQARKIKEQQESSRVQKEQENQRANKEKEEQGETRRKLQAETDDRKKLELEKQRKDEVKRRDEESKLKEQKQKLEEEKAKKKAEELKKIQEARRQEEKREEELKIKREAEKKQKEEEKKEERLKLKRQEEEKAERSKIKREADMKQREEEERKKASEEEELKKASKQKDRQVKEDKKTQDRATKEPEIEKEISDAKTSQTSQETKKDRPVFNKDGTIGDEVVIGAQRYMERHGLTENEEGVSVVDESSKYEANNLIWLIGGLVVFLIGMMFLLFKQEKVEDEAEIRRRYGRDIDFSAITNDPKHPVPKSNQNSVNATQKSGVEDNSDQPKETAASKGSKNAQQGKKVSSKVEAVDIGGKASTKKKSKRD